ncbi:helicase-exonuclease AddAB subunit AddA [Fictibacillus phosphorivorans]|uniref:helicase-exonuclease AddAB subunit AddA n=1 Tax=Fictibacillus phosphorivorans TaxID=1221500 RepID=UPI002041C541|nr:helicase-exonuclease AddAB subunit AddA [Fictibacillus phosphorivorans]MCM3718662.1 helicase-exonuclease AddAB subunit AddA [Fictibacillus phosphorivorans]MCM3776285.1 helicase-exonuclease AddAB subunit AddA [Fictibacillus phosphorivorans]
MKTLIPKPEGSTWTDEQWQAIQARGENILVAAAAGSGKTAVLVERIITMIKEKSADVDRLLIVTFTNAAAAEMRKRIGEAIDKELTKHPSSLHLRRQLNLLNKASISTLHSFCIEVLRKYYYETDLDPGFRVAEETEAELIRQEVIEELFEEEYSKGEDHTFYQVVDAYSSDRNDMDLQKLILSLYDFARSHPDPESWLDEMADAYEINASSIDDLPWTKELLADISLQLDGLQAMAIRARDLAETPGGPLPYAGTLEEDLEFLQMLNRVKDNWSQLYEVFQTYEPPKLKAVRGKEIDEDLKNKVKAMRDTIKKKTVSLKEEYFERHPDSYVAHIEEMAPIVRELSLLVKEFGRRYSVAKREKSLVDFGDLEHYCLQVLKGEGSTMDNPVPSDAASEYRDRFVEVLVDEYQDTNFVQESIVRLVSKDAGNMFMVGDVKQSIYRFRLAEPLLFLSKYKEFTKEGGNGLRIDLAKNFRSRNGVLQATNYLFRQIMNETVGEIEYSEDAELKLGADYYPEQPGNEPELILINKSQPVIDEEGLESGEMEKSDLETVQLEARVIAERIKEIVGTTGNSPHLVLDKKTKMMRPAKYKDIVLLFRATSQWAPVILEEFKQQGIPAHAELSTGYFDATEIHVMMSLLKVIDNPLQDIPLAAVLRSPIVGLSGEELAIVRLIQKKDNYLGAVELYSEEGENQEIKEKLSLFLKQLESWRHQARQGSLADLIWDIYRETGYFDYVGGLAGGKQRQANLRALYDRAKMYESTSFRGLFRFLRFIERMQERGKDLGAARALGEQEDVVRIMTIHKSKGLEFPIVFVGGLNKQFNTRDLKEKVLLHKELGLGTQYINPVYRVTYPTLPRLAIIGRKKMELIAEEMRVLYVALTRAKEKLYLVGTVNDIEKSAESWSDSLFEENWLLPDHERAGVKSYLDWIGRAVIRHKNAGPLLSVLGTAERGRGEVFIDETDWKITILPASEYEELETTKEQEQEELLLKLKQSEPVAITSVDNEEVSRRLSWQYQHMSSTATRSKQSVTELKKQFQTTDEYSSTDLVKAAQPMIHERPRFMQESQLSAAEAGTAMHMVMQHVDFKSSETLNDLEEQVTRMESRELLTSEQARYIQFEQIKEFIDGPLGQRIRESENVKREIPFSMALPLSETRTSDEEEAHVLVQGVIDCLIEDEDGFVLIDYKTDKIHNRFTKGFSGARETLLNRYEMQLTLYAKAIERILKKPVKESYLYFFDGGHILQVK